MKIKSELDLTNEATRMKIIEAIKLPENVARKDKFYKFYQCYKDNTREYVLRHILKQFDADTVEEMSYAITNLGFARKVVDKLARVYNYGVEREVYVNEEKDDELTEALSKLAKEIDANRLFKKTNRWLKRDKNCVQYLVPKEVNPDQEDSKKIIKPSVLPAYLYDVVEYESDREKAACYILSDYNPRRNQTYYTTGNPGIRPIVGDAQGNFPYTDGIDSVIADSPSDQDDFKGNFIFWSDKYHFTCNEKGQLIDKDGNLTQEIGLNPIGVKPFINYAEDQDNSFWAEGGDDLIDGAISINSMITNIIHIAITQGYGQAVVSGRNVPRVLKLGPNKVILLEQNNADDPVPNFKFETANPPLDQLKVLVEFYVALLLTTNNLSTSGVSSSLNAGGSFPSGVSMIIDKAESMEDIDDQRQIFVDNEPLFWEVYARWHAVLKSTKELTEDLDKITFPQAFSIMLKFGKPQAIVSENERLDAMKKKKDLGIVSKIDMLKMEYPDLSDEQLAKKIEEIFEEGVASMAIVPDEVMPPVPVDEEEVDEEDGDQVD